MEGWKVQLWTTPEGQRPRSQTLLRAPGGGAFAVLFAVKNYIFLMHLRPISRNTGAISCLGNPRDRDVRGMLNKGITACLAALHPTALPWSARSICGSMAGLGSS